MSTLIEKQNNKKSVIVVTSSPGSINLHFIRNFAK